MIRVPVFVNTTKLIKNSKDHGMNNRKQSIDVAVPSFNKPESLIYTLLSLKKSCGDYIDTVFIQDDCSDKGVVSHYFSGYFI
jgi:hypothetical protein